MAHGHPEARHYPVPMLSNEAAIVVNRLNREHATNAVLTQMAVSSVLSKKAGKQFEKRIKQLNEG